MTDKIICPACKTDASGKQFDSQSGYELYKCPKCTLSFAWPMKAGEQDFYEDFVIYRSLTAEQAKRDLTLVSRRKFNRRLAKMLPPEAKVLDVGCGIGEFVKFCRNHNLDAYGIDFNANSIANGIKHYYLEGRLIAGDFKELDKHIPNAKFDLIVIFEVIEHVEDPQALLNSISARLKPGGLLVISCPNEKRWKLAGRIFVDYPPHHLTRWTPDALSHFVCKCDFTLNEIDLDCSFRDLIWTFLVNWKNSKSTTAQSAEKTRKDKSASSSSFAKTVLRKIYPSLDVALRTILCPIDWLLKVSNTGTMGMRLIFKKVDNKHASHKRHINKLQ